MAYAVDFQELKKAVTIEQVADFVGLTLKKDGAKFRSPCPVSERGGDRAVVVTPAKQLFYCFPCAVGGDLIKLASHVKDIGAKEAAELIAQAAGLNDPAAQRANDKETPPALSQHAPVGLAKVRTYLVWDHPKVAELGLTPQQAERLGIGYKPKGMFRGSVVVPLHERSGKLIGYAGITELGLTFPDLEG